MSGDRTEDTAREALADKAEALTVRLAEDLCLDPGTPCQECYDIACQVLASPALDAVVAERVAALAEDVPPSCLDNVLRTLRERNQS